MNRFIEEQKLIVILRGIPLEKVENLAKALYDGGARVMEVTFDQRDENTLDDTAEKIKIIKSTLGDDVLVGAGTVLSKEQVKVAKEAGSSFIISPNTDIEVIKHTKEFGMLSIPGAFTPSEIMVAYNAGADYVKFFPITKDDIGYLKNITSPISHVPLICTGGVNPDTIELFLKNGAVALGTGASILKPELIEKEDYTEITRLTMLHFNKIKEATNPNDVICECED